MVLYRLLILSFIAIAFASTAWAEDPVYYQRKDTWQETLRCSRQALVEWEAANSEKDAGMIGLSTWYILGPVYCGVKRFDFAPVFTKTIIDRSKPYDLMRWRRE